MHSKNKNFPELFYYEPLAHPYFCLDTSLNRTLAYAHGCNWGEGPGVYKYLFTIVAWRRDSLPGICRGLASGQFLVRAFWFCTCFGFTSWRKLFFPGASKAKSMALLPSRSSLPKYHSVVLKPPFGVGGNFFAAIARGSMLWMGLVNHNRG